MESFRDDDISTFCEKVASDKPTPGGGSVAAIAAAQAASLAKMVSNLTLGKEKWQDGWNSAEDAISMSDIVYANALDLADQDSTAFDEVMAAYRLPKEDDEQKKTRKQAIEDASEVAARVPLKTAKIALDLLRTLPALARTGNSNAITDVGVAGLLCQTAIKGALWNVEINLYSVSQQIKEELSSEIDSIRSEATPLLDDLEQVVISKL